VGKRATNPDLGALADRPAADGIAF